MTESNKRYTITITEHGIEEVPAGREWKEGAGDEGENKYGYTPRIMKEKQVDREIYKQNSDTLHLKDVIKAVNGF